MMGYSGGILYYLVQTSSVQYERESSLKGRDSVEQGQGRDLKYSIYTGIDRASRDLSQMRDHSASRQIERALERVRTIEKNMGSQVNILIRSTPPFDCQATEPPF